MVQPCAGRQLEVMGKYRWEFKHRFVGLLDCSFRDLDSGLALLILENGPEEEAEGEQSGEKPDLTKQFTTFQLRRLRAYYRRQVEFASISDLVPAVFQWFEFKAGMQSLTSVQKRILLAVGGQRKSFAEVAHEMNMEQNQAQAIFSKIIAGMIRTVDQEAIGQE